MKKLLLSLVFLCGCTAVPVRGPSPVTNTGQDLNAIAAQVTQAYVEYKAGNVNYAWAAAQALQAYKTISQTKEDVKKLISAWTSSPTFAEKLANLFATSSGTPEAKMNALQKGVTMAAGNNGP